MGKKLYVGNLTYSTTEAELKEMFEAVGPVASVSIVTDRDTGSSKGFGFVEMETDEAAQNAIQQLNGKDLNGRSLRIDEARPPRERSSFGGGERRGGGGFGDRGGGYDRGYGGGGERRGGGGRGGKGKSDRDRDRDRGW